jgi:hypothetical protein
MQAGPGGFGPGPDDSAPLVAVRIIAVGRFTGPVSYHRAK